MDIASFTANEADAKLQREFGTVGVWIENELIEGRRQRNEIGKVNSCDDSGRSGD